MLQELDSDYILRIDLIPQGEYRFQGFGGLTRIVLNGCVSLDFLMPTFKMIFLPVWLINTL